MSSSFWKLRPTFPKNDWHKFCVYPSWWVVRPWLFNFVIVKPLGSRNLNFLYGLASLSWVYTCKAYGIGEYVWLLPKVKNVREAKTSTGTVASRLQTTVVLMPLKELFFDHTRSYYLWIWCPCEPQISMTPIRLLITLRKVHLHVRYSRFWSILTACLCTEFRFRSLAKSLWQSAKRIVKANV